MQLSMYQASVPVFTQGLTSLSSILAKAAAHAEARGIAPAELLDARLAPDMFPLMRQVQIADYFAKSAPARLAGQEVPRVDDDEASFDELQRRIATTLEMLGGYTAAQIDGSEDREFTLPIPGQPMTLKGLPYLVHFALPNFWFHVTTAYAILRHRGVEIGKRDFIGTF